MQRLFSTFPAGLAGLGSLVLRVALAICLSANGGEYIASNLQGSGSAAAIGWAVGGLLMICAGLICVGFLTPIALSVVTAIIVGSAMMTAGPPGVCTSLNDQCQVRLLEVAIAIGGALLGPGAYSIDASLFGRREIEIPPPVRSRQS